MSVDDRLAGRGGNHYATIGNCAERFVGNLKSAAPGARDRQFLDLGIGGHVGLAA